MRVLENRLTWSKSRVDTFGQCLRRYWWTYYGSWGGWSSDAPRAAREAYVLKNLHSRWTWVGDAVHRAIQRILERLRLLASDDPGLAFEDGGAIDPDAEVARLTDSMRAQYRDSREGRYRADPKRAFGLLEHEYGVPVADTEWREMHRRAVEALRGLLSSHLFSELAASDPRKWLPIDQLDSFEFEGTEVWAALDFARRTATGAEVYDWKTGEQREGENALQLLVYALYMEARHAIPASQVVSRLVYVNSGKVHEVAVTAESLEGARRTMRDSIGEMRERLRMGGGTDPSMLAFPMTDDRERCVTCAFRRFCER